MTVNEQKVAWIQSFMDCHADSYGVSAEAVAVQCTLGCQCCKAIVRFGLADMTLRSFRVAVIYQEDGHELGQYALETAAPIFESAEKATCKWRTRNRV